MIGPRKRMTDEEIQQAYAEARRRMRAGSAAASLADRGYGARFGAQPSPDHLERLHAGPQPTPGMLTGGRVALDLGRRQNTSQGPRAGQQFRDYVSGGKEYHQYAGGPTIAVKARAPEIVRQQLFAAHPQSQLGAQPEAMRQAAMRAAQENAPQQTLGTTGRRRVTGAGQNVQDRLTHLAQAYAQRGRVQEQPQTIQRRLLANRRRRVV